MGKLSIDPVIHHFSHHHPLELSTCQQINTTPPCSGCKLPLSGWLCTCKPCNFSLHLPCSKAPQLIHHPSHPNHTLSLLPHPPYPQGYFNYDACGHRGDAFSYHCATCYDDLHILCASLPLSLFHQAHHHPLNLTFFTPYQNKRFSCDICRNMGSNHWLYRCGVCEFDAHLACAGGELRPLVQAQGPNQPQQHEMSQKGCYRYAAVPWSYSQICEWPGCRRSSGEEWASVFHRGALPMLKKKDFPQGCSRTSHEDYEVVHLPWSKTQPLTDCKDLVKISAMPGWVQPAFNGLDQLNMVQSQAYQTALYTFNNILLCAPAAAGKTNVAILTILLHLSHHSHYKIVYLAPTKAMVSDMVRTLSTRLHHYRVNVKEHSSDRTLSPQQMEVTQIIISTPEMWDSLSSYTHLVKLVIIDGVHLHIKRRLVLQRIVERTSGQKIQDIRLVGLSIPIPNFKEMGSFLNVDFEMGLFYFDSSFRGGPLDQWCIGIKGENPWPLMNHICYEKVFMAVARNHQVLIFVCSKMETAQTASAIRKIAIARGTVGCFLKEENSSRRLEILNKEAGTVKSWFLKDLLLHGFGIYHGEMAREERELVVEHFINGKIQVLVSTTGLAWGVNLPAHLVIIKGTQIYGEELDPVVVMEMLGRAGRPQFDSCGEGIVMTSYHNLADYVWLMNE